MNKKIILFLALYILVQANIFSQVNAKKILSDYVAMMAQITMPEKNKTHYLHFRINNSYRKAINAPKTFDIKSYLTKDQMIINSSLSKVYADADDIIVLIPSTRQIVRYDGLKTDSANVKRQELVNAQFNLIKNSELLQCDSTLGNLLQITLRPNKILREQMKIEKIALVFNNVLKKIKSVQIIYNQSSILSNQLIEYKELNFSSKVKLELMPAKSRIIQDYGGLRPEYAGYNLIDNRTKRGN
ncbi:MAG: hypothetical protein N4A74_19030 [Carboxylicivirga sp.]|jgi:hypothetical protein|nr:hypothetical protein [Carboxylicivirga sp.]